MQRESIINQRRFCTKVYMGIKITLRKRQNKKIRLMSQTSDGF